VCIALQGPLGPSPAKPEKTLQRLVEHVVLETRTQMPDRVEGPAGRAAAAINGVPKGIRTPVAAVKGQCPRPLDDGDPIG